MFCPKCKTEYRKCFYVCADCHVSLVDQLPPESELSSDVENLEADSNSNEDNSLDVIDSEDIPDNAVLLKTAKSMEDFFEIVELLKAHSIQHYTVEEEDASLKKYDDVVFLYKIYVEDSSYHKAIDVIKSLKEDLNHEWDGYKQKIDKSGKLLNRVLGFISAAFFYALSFLPLKEGQETFKYFFYGASIFFLVIVLLSFFPRKKVKH
ncbi:MAG: hypothetical protein WC539_08220 [Nitrospirota bacterium]